MPRTSISHPTAAPHPSLQNDPPAPSSPSSSDTDSQADLDFAPSHLHDPANDSDSSSSSSRSSHPSSPAHKTAKKRRPTSRAASIDADELTFLQTEHDQLSHSVDGTPHLGKRQRRGTTSTVPPPTPCTPDPSSVHQTDADSERAKAAAELAWDQIKTSAPIPAPISDPTPAPIATSTTTAAAAPPRRPPARRKPASKLSSLSSSAAAKPAKLNTLEKSKRDWEAFKASADGITEAEREEIERQTRGGGGGLGRMEGFLDRRDFLDRVQERTGGGRAG